MRALPIALAFICGTTAALAQQPSPFPEGPGREIVAVACTQCHAPGPIVQMRMGEQGWRHEVENMILRGAQIGPDDLDAVATYLATGFGPGVPLAGPPTPTMHLTAGAGAELVEGNCALCHGLDRAVGTRRSSSEWEKLVHHMVAIGAPLDDDDAKAAITYLQAHYVPTAP